MNFPDYIIGAASYYAANAQEDQPLRVGQAFYSYLSEHHNALALIVCTTQVDPYEDDSKLGVFLQYVADHLPPTQQLTTHAHAI